MDLQNLNVETPLSCEVDTIVSIQESNKDSVSFVFFDVILFNSFYF